MEKSFLNFKASNPSWVPSDPTGSLFLSRLTDLNPHQSTILHPPIRSPLSHLSPDPEFAMSTSLHVDTSRLAPQPGRMRSGTAGKSASAGRRTRSRSAQRNGSGRQVETVREEDGGGGVEIEENGWDDVDAARGRGRDEEEDRREEEEEGLPDGGLGQLLMGVYGARMGKGGG